jgi:hypothetical protein
MGTLPRILAALALACGALSAGCESRVSLGATCELASDCPSPMVCKMGRCRAECREARDCPFPLECMMENGVGGCRVPEDGSCPRGTVDCGQGLDCVGGRCMQPCTDHTDCATAQTCEPTGGCDRNETGPCDILSGSGCASGERCGQVGGVVQCLLLTASVPRVGELFASCDGTSAPCRDGLTCVEGRCLRWCARDSGGAVLSNCGDDSTCLGSDAIGGDPPPDGLGYCTQPCDPTSPTAAGCPEGFGCGITQPSRASYTLCEPSSAAGARWGACDNQRCAVGLDCLHGVFDVGVCLARCEDASDCMDGLEDCDTASGTLTVTDHLGVEHTVGVCRPTCDQPIDCPSTLPGMVTCPDGMCGGA